MWEIYDMNWNGIKYIFFYVDRFFRWLYKLIDKIGYL